MPFTLVHGLAAFLLVLPFTRDKKLLLLAFIGGLTPDMDGLPILFDQNLFYQLHHVITHPLIAGIIFALIVAFLLTHFLKMDFRPSVLFFFLGFVSHIVTDLLFTNWPIPLFFPFYNAEFSYPIFLTYSLFFSVAITLLAVIAIVWLLLSKKAVV